MSAVRGPLPAHLDIPYWRNRMDDPRDAPAFCERQSRKTPTIPWHNGYPKCLSCGEVQSPWAWACFWRLCAPAIGC
jgi:hypothetical protein